MSYGLVFYLPFYSGKVRASTSAGHRCSGWQRRIEVDDMLAQMLNKSRS